MTTIPAAVTRDLIVRFVSAHVAEHGFPPSVREIGAVLGLSSSSTVQHHIDVLVAEGRLRRRPGTSRTLSVAPAANAGSHYDGAQSGGPGERVTAPGTVAPSLRGKDRSDESG